MGSKEPTLYDSFAKKISPKAKEQLMLDMCATSDPTRKKYTEYESLLVVT